MASMARVHFCFVRDTAFHVPHNRTVPAYLFGPQNVPKMPHRALQAGPPTVAARPAATSNTGLQCLPSQDK